MSDLMRCTACGGAVVYDAKSVGAACMFCGAQALSAAPADEEIPTPDAMLPLEVDEPRAAEQYRAWARSSWWYPKELRHLRIALRPMMLPAWRYHSSVESHWTGLERAMTRSGKRPQSGSAHAELWHMVPASGGLEPAELTELQPFHEDRGVDWVPDQQHLPWEPPAVTERGVRNDAHDALAAIHRGAIARENDLLSCNSSALIDDHDVRLYMLPIYIGAFRYRARPWRFVVNAQTGEVVGKAPIDRMKVAMVVSLVVALIAVVAFFAGR